jgi:hypothetical protein
VAVTNPDAKKHVNRTDIEDENLERGYNAVAQEDPVNQLTETIEQGDQQWPGIPFNGS